MIQPDTVIVADLHAYTHRSGATHIITVTNTSVLSLGVCGREMSEACEWCQVLIITTHMMASSVQTYGRELSEAHEWCKVHIITTHKMVSFLRAYGHELSEAYEWCKRHIVTVPSDAILAAGTRA